MKRSAHGWADAWLPVGDLATPAAQSAKRSGARRFNGPSDANRNVGHVRVYHLPAGYAGSWRAAAAPPAASPDGMVDRSGAGEARTRSHQHNICRHPLSLACPSAHRLRAARNFPLSTVEPRNRVYAPEKKNVLPRESFLDGIIILARNGITGPVFVFVQRVNLSETLIPFAGTFTHRFQVLVRSSRNTGKQNKNTYRPLSGTEGEPPDWFTGSWVGSVPFQTMYTPYARSPGTNQHLLVRKS